MNPPQPYAEAELPTPRGSFRMIVYRAGDEEHLALVKGDVAGRRDVLCRVHSECLTGEVLGSLRCDCRHQLEHALDRIADAGAGVLVYLRQEGRGIGLGNKIRAYALQDEGADTVEANLKLGFEADQRSYDIAAAILENLELESVRLMTNDPTEISGLERAGITVVAQEPHWVGANDHSRAYLEVKKAKLGHIESSPSASEGEKASGQ